jgi:hypothetical protein
MRRGVTIVLAVVSVWWSAGASAATRVEVIGTDPPGDTLVLGRNQNYSLRLRYTSDEPARIWVRPYFRGKPVDAGTSPSGGYAGEGEAIGWFFLMKPGDEVDEVRINAGDGSRDGTHQVATHRVHLVAGSQPARADASPAWVVELLQKNEAAAREAYEQSARTPPSTGEMALFRGFMLGMLGLGLFGFAAPAWGMWRWQRGWRFAAAVPAAAMTFVALRIAFDTARDPTSHNLWPFEILQVGGLSVVVMAALLAARRFSSTSR